MKIAITPLAVATLALVVSASPSVSADTKTWYVYCEGAGQGDHWAVFSDNFWPHPATEGYGRRVGSAAKAFFEARHDVQLDGCAAVSFVEVSLAEHSRSRTAQLHKRMGDRVLYFPLPSEALPAEIAALPAEVIVQTRVEPEAEPVAVRSPIPDASSAFSPHRPER